LTGQAHPPLLALDHVGRVFDGGRIVGQKDTTLSIARGELVAIHGPSGSGKSTLLNLMSGIDRPTSGHIAFDGLADPSPAAWARLRASRIGVICQDFHLLPALTAVENVEIAAFGQIRDAKVRREAAMARLAEAGVGHCIGQRPPQLSGGERRRVGVARALINGPELLLADEPTSNLDSVTGAAVMDLLLELHARRGVTLVIVTHDPTVLARCPRRIRMQDALVAEDVLT
jgi:putative ABC transport system ATP-binding protein